MRFDVARKIFIEESLNANKIAFAASDKDVTWAELKILSDKICDALSSVSKKVAVLVYGNKEAFFLASILSCYRSGLTFIPISPSLPKKRIEKITEQTKSEVLINCGNYSDVPNTNTILGKELTVTIPSRGRFGHGGNAAYILFTSGSSGEPKGVVVSDENIISFTKWFTEEFKVDDKTVFINHADFSFDISLADFFGALQTGGTGVFNTTEISANNALFFERINKYKGTYWNSTPSVVSRCLADKNFNSQNLPGINKFVLSGENLSTQLVKDLKIRFPLALIINAYGPTETTIYACYSEVTNELLSESTLPICKTSDANISLQNNEILISGDRVGSGYLNNEALTKERFVVDGDKKTFHTGDFAEIKNDYIYYKGRKDEQIKFNGYRIELQEIKYVIEKTGLISQAECVPVLIENKIKRIIAFVKPNKENFDVSLLKAYLEKEIPHYMIPSEIIVLKEFPLTSSFKVDKQKLLADYLNPPS